MTAGARFYDSPVKDRAISRIRTGCTWESQDCLSQS